MHPLSAAFFERPTLAVAVDLIGHLLVREEPDGERLVGRIVETEAYTQDDPAFHGWGLVDRETGLVRPEGRAYDLFGAPGTAYIYLVYFRNWLLNVVTEPEGIGGAVLIRAVEPVEGLAVMRSRRSAARRDRDLTNGPGKLCEAFDLDERFHGRRLTEPPVYLAEGDPSPERPIATSSRIGLRHGIERPWRFYVDGHPYVSPGKPSDEVARKEGSRG